MDEVGQLIDLASKLTVTAVLGLIAYGYVFGKIPTRAEVNQIEKRVDGAEARAARAD